MEWLEATNLGLLAMCWACSLSSSTLLTAVGPLAASALGASDASATLAIGAFLLGASVVSIPSAALFGRFGRRVGFLVGCSFNMVAGIVGVVGVVVNALPCIFMACFLSGLSQGLAQFYRFAAMEVCAPSRKPFAVTLVLSGGVIAAFAGPNLAEVTKRIDFGGESGSGGDEERLSYLGSFAIVSCIGLLNALLSAAVVFKPQASPPKPSGGSQEAYEEPMLPPPPLTPLLQLMTAPRCVAAICAATVAHTSMVMLMAPLTIVMHKGCDQHVPIGECWRTSIATIALEIHFVCMFAPGFVTGRLIQRFGPPRVAAAGIVVFGAAAAVMLAGGGLVNFIVGMGVCGFGWNLTFSSGTVLLASCYAPQDAPRVQGANDFIIFFIAGAGSLGSGYINSSLGWDAVNWVVVGLMGVLLAIFLAFLCAPTEAPQVVPLGSSTAELPIPRDASVLSQARRRRYPHSNRRGPRPAGADLEFQSLMLGIPIPDAGNSNP